MLIIDDRVSYPKFTDEIQRQKRKMKNNSMNGLSLSTWTRLFLENMRKEKAQPGGKNLPPTVPGPTRVETKPAERPKATTERFSIVDAQTLPAEDLLNAVACHLSGKRVSVRYGEPESDNLSASGTCRHLPDGACRITISDTLTGAQSRFSTFLHECAHARFDGQRAAEKPQVKKMIENRADLQASVWQTFAEKHVYKFDSSSEPYFTKMLRALLTYENPF